MGFSVGLGVEGYMLSQSTEWSSLGRRVSVTWNHSGKGELRKEGLGCPCKAGYECAERLVSWLDRMC